MFRELLFVLLRFSGLPVLIREVIQRRVVTIVTYHRLDAITAERHFRVLRRHYNPISLQTYINARRDGSVLPPKSLIVTIDDGHHSVYELKPVLEKHRLPITVFLCSGLVGTNRRFWFSAPRLNESHKQYLKTVPDAVRLEALRSLGFDQSADFPDRDSLNLSEVRGLMDLVDFQSHSVSHPILPACSDEKAQQEIWLSKQHLEEAFHVRVNALAYPNGSYGERELKLTEAAGYECGLTMDPGFNDSRTKPFALRRLAVPDRCSVHELTVRACCLWAWGRSIALRLNRRQSAWMVDGELRPGLVADK